MGAVVIGGNSYQVYGDQAGATLYFAADFGVAGAAFNAADPTVKQRQALVLATRLLDRQEWQGLPVGIPQIDVVLQWPRSGVVDENNAAVSSSGVPDRLIKACYELAGLIIASPSTFSNETSGQNIKSVGGSGVPTVQFFFPTLGISGRFPIQVQELIGQFLGGSVTPSVDGSFSSGTDGSATTSFGTDPGDGGFGLNKGLQ